MPQDVHCEILSTIQTIQIQPDERIQITEGNCSGIECRICLEETGPFIVPCKCDGTMKYVHEKCLKKWASDRVKKQVQKQEDKANGQLSSIHGLPCELCKQNIAMQVHKRKKILKWSEAKQSSQQFFLPFLPLVIANILISLVCIGALIFVLAFSLMIVFKNQQVDYKKYMEHQLIMWGILTLSGVFAGVFLVKSVIELYHIFVKEQFQVTKIIPSLAQFTESIKTTGPDCTNLKQFNLIDTASTPATPMGNQTIFQNKLSLTRKKMNLQKQIAREVAQRKIIMGKQNVKSSVISSIQQKNFQ